MDRRFTAEVQRPQRMHGETIEKNSLRTLRLRGEPIFEIDRERTTKTRRPQRMHGEDDPKKRSFSVSSASLWWNNKRAAHRRAAQKTDHHRKTGLCPILIFRSYNGIRLRALRGSAVTRYSQRGKVR